MSKKVSILIDGANFYLRALKLLNISDAQFDYDAFVQFLAGKRKICKNGKRFYIGTVRTKLGDRKSINAVARQNSLFTRLKQSGWDIKTSKHKMRTEEINIDERVQGYQKIQKLGLKKIIVNQFREKGIDVKIATDLIVGAVDKQYDEAIILSSDTDLIPAIDWVRNRCGKKVEYVGFSIQDSTNPNKSSKPSVALIDRTDTQRILVDTDLQPFILPTTKPLPGTAKN